MSRVSHRRYIPRAAEARVAAAVRTFPVVVVTGARQSGKSTMLFERFSKGRSTAALDALDVRGLAAADPRAFLGKFPPPVIIDEFQNVPDLLPYIKEMADSEKKPGMFILTGSSHFPGMKGISESLAGRAAILRLFPLTFSESRREKRGKDFSLTARLLRASDAVPVSRSIGPVLLRGGYPGLHANPSMEAGMFFSSYLQTYLDRDVRGSVRNGNLRDFETFLRLLAARTGRILNLSEISSAVGISVPTVKSWISLLEESSIIFLLHPYYRNFGKRLTKAPKLYFVDTGLAAFLVGLKTAEHLLSGPMAGELFETFVVSELYKKASTALSQDALFYWRSSDRHEVDLLVESEGRLTPVEVKLSSTLNSGHFKPIEDWREISGETESGGFIISSAETDYPPARGIRNVHWSRI